MAKGNKGERSLWGRLLRLVMWGAITVVVLIGIFLAILLRPVKGPAPNAVKTAPVIGSSAPLAQISQLADMTLPPAPKSLRINSPEFAAGMRAYAGGDCTNAVPHLLRVSPEEEEGTTARFYAAACQLAAHKLIDATHNFLRVTGNVEAPEYEAAHYYLAQVMLANGDVASARRYLRCTIAMGGDYVAQARAQLDKVGALR